MERSFGRPKWEGRGKGPSHGLRAHNRARESQAGRKARSPKPKHGHVRHPPRPKRPHWRMVPQNSPTQLRLRKPHSRLPRRHPHHHLPPKPQIHPHPRRRLTRLPRLPAANDTLARRPRLLLDEDMLVHGYADGGFPHLVPSRLQRLALSSDGWQRTWVQVFAGAGGEDRCCD